MKYRRILALMTIGLIMIPSYAPGAPTTQFSMEKKVTLGVCRNCHTKDRSPAFNYCNILAV